MHLRSDEAISSQKNDCLMSTRERRDFTVTTVKKIIYVVSKSIKGVSKNEFLAYWVLCSPIFGRYAAYSFLLVHEQEMPR